MDDYYPFGLTFNSYQRENSLENKYTYSGKEKQDELELGWLDYGPRMYMPDIGRFNRMDIFSALNASQTSYSYAGNDPVNSTDMGGNFQFPVEFRQQYPRVTAYLEKMLPHLQNNVAVVNKLHEHTKLSKDVIKREFQNGSGPEINPRDLGDPYGKSLVIGRLDMNSKTVLDQLEAGLATNGDPQYQEFTDTYIFFTIVTILHEYVHDASKRTKYRLPLGMKPGYDEGSNWTEDTFGSYIQNPTEKIAAENKPSNPKFDETAQSYLRSTPRNSDLFIGIFFITSPTNGNGNSGNQKKKPDADRERKKKTG